MSLKDLIPNETVLAEVVAGNLSFVTKAVKDEVGHLEAEYKKFKRQQLIAAALFISPFFLLQFTPSIFDIVAPVIPTLYDEFALVIFFVSMSICAFYGFKLMFTGNEVIQRFHAGVNKILFLKVFSLLKLNGELIEHTVANVNSNQNSKPFKNYLSTLAPPDTPERAATLNRLRESELITESHNTNVVDNLFELWIEGRKLEGSELLIQHITGSGKNRSVKRIFKGYFMSFELAKRLEGKTFVSTEGDEYGFGHKAFFSGKKDEGLRETTLEWNQFEKLLHVATNNETEARYVLTTDFMSDLYSWWESRKGNIRISFIGNRMYILFPDSKVKFNDTIPRIGTKEVEKYLLTIATPLLHVVHLIEDVRL